MSCAPNQRRALWLTENWKTNIPSRYKPPIYWKIFRTVIKQGNATSCYLKQERQCNKRQKVKWNSKIPFNTLMFIYLSLTCRSKCQEECDNRVLLICRSGVHINALYLFCNPFSNCKRLANIIWRTKTASSRGHRLGWIFSQKLTTRS